MSFTSCLIINLDDKKNLIYLLREHMKRDCIIFHVQQRLMFVFSQWSERPLKHPRGWTGKNKQQNITRYNCKQNINKRQKETNWTKCKQLSGVHLHELAAGSRWTLLFALLPASDLSLFICLIFSDTDGKYSVKETFATIKLFISYPFLSLCH